MLVIRNLTKIYKPQKSQEIVALNKLNINFGDKGLVFVLGKSGCGKSTLLNMIGGLDYPTSGEIIIEGKSSSTFSKSDFDNYRNTYIGFVFQEHNLLNDFNVEQNILLATELQGKPRDKNMVSQLLKDVDLEGYENRKIDTLSGGQKQRVTIARALIKNPKIILADEPTGALDSKNGKDVLNQLKRLSKEKLVIVVSHDRESAEKYADRIIELSDGIVTKDSNNNAKYSTENSDEFKGFIKSKMPLLKSLRMGFSIFRKKPFKLSFTVLLSSVAFALFGVASCFVLYDSAVTRNDALVKLKADSELFVKKAEVNVTYNLYSNYENKVIEHKSDVLSRERKISQSEIDKLNSNSKLGHDYIGVYSNGMSNFYVPLDGGYASPNKSLLYSFSCFSGFAESNNEYMLRNGFTLVSGSYPETANEIAISNYHADLILNYYKSSNLYHSYDELIGLKLKIQIDNSVLELDDTLFTIKGIYDVGQIDKSYFDKYLSTNEEKVIDETKSDSFATYMKGSYKLLSFVSDKFYEKYFLVFDKEPESLVVVNDTSFSGVKMGKEPIDIVLRSAEESFVTTKFNKPENYIFYNINRENVPFKEPDFNEAYLFGPYYKYEHYSKIKNKIADIFSIIEECKNMNTDLDLDTSFQDKDFKNIFDTISRIAENTDDLGVIEKMLSNEKYKSVLSVIANEHFPECYRRVYITSYLTKLVEYNEIGNFGYEAFDSNSGSIEWETFSRILEGDRTNKEVFDDAESIIKNNDSLRTFSDRIVQYETIKNNPFIFKNNRSLENAFKQIDLKIQNGIGLEITSLEWNDLSSLYLASADAYISNNSLFVEYLPLCFRSGLIAFDSRAEILEFEKDISFPEKLYYKNYEGRSGEIRVLGYYYPCEGDYKYPSKNYFVNESFATSIGHKPGNVYYYDFVVDYQQDNNAKYDMVITKSNFSINQIHEITKKEKGYSLYFTNESLVSIEHFVSSFSMLNKVFLGIGAFVGIFAVALLINFISNSISLKKKEIGIIRGLGGRSSNIFEIFSFESLVVGAFSGIVASTLTLIACVVFNRFTGDYLNLKVLNFTYMNFLIVFVLSVAISFIASLFPILANNKKAPVDLLR